MHKVVSEYKWTERVQVNRAPINAQGSEWVQVNRKGTSEQSEYIDRNNKVAIFMHP